MNRTSIIMLLGACFLGMLAAVGVWTMSSQPAPAPAATGPQNRIVVAARDIPFGARIEPAALQTIAWPAALPDGSFSSADEILADGRQTALRAFRPGEPIVAVGISGKSGRLASSAQLGPDMRAIAIAVDEITSAGGFVAPGDRVDVLVTHRARDDMASVTVVAQGLRVLAAGQVQDPGASEPQLVKSLTLEVSPHDAQKIALARSIGTLGVMLRATGDDAQTTTPVLNMVQAFGIRPTGPAPAAVVASAPSAASSAVLAARPRHAGGPEVSIVRGTEATSYRVAQ